MDKAREPHQKATHKDLKRCFTQNQQTPSYLSAHQALFNKTLSLYRTYRAYGCLGPVDPFVTTAANNTNKDDQQWTAQIERSRRGHDPKLACGGKIIFDYDHDGKAFVRFVLDILFIVHAYTNPYVKV
jgi:hypothetical protein